MDFISKSRVYIVIDEQNRIIQIEGEYSLSNIHDLSSAILAEEGPPCDRLNHAQTAYLDKSIMTADGVYRYKWDGSAVVLRTEEELEADRAAILESKPSKTVESRLTALEAEAEQAKADREALNILLGGAE